MMVFRLILVLLTVTVAFSHVVKSHKNETHASSTVQPVIEPGHHIKDEKHNRRVMMFKPPNSNDGALNCPFSERVSKLIDILLEFIKGSPYSNLVELALSTIKNYFDNVPLNVETEELRAKFKELEAIVLRDKNIERNQFQSDATKYNSKTTVIFKQRLPGTHQLQCQDSFTKLIKEAYDKYSQVAMFPNCMTNDFPPKKQMTSLPFSIIFDDPSPLFKNNDIQQNNRFNLFSGNLPLQNSHSVEYLQQHKYFYPPQSSPYNQLLLPKLLQQNVSPSNIQALPNYYNPNELRTYPPQSKVLFDPSNQVVDGKIPVLEEKWPNHSQHIFPAKYDILSQLNGQPVDNLHYIPNDITETDYNAAPVDLNFFKKPNGVLDKTSSTISNLDKLLLNQLGLAIPTQLSTHLATSVPASININNPEQVMKKDKLLPILPEDVILKLYNKPATYAPTHQMRAQDKAYLPSQMIDNKLIKLDKLPILNNNVYANEPQGLNLDTFNVPIQYDKDMLNQNMPYINKYLTSPNDNLNENQILKNTLANYGQLIDGEISAPDLKRLPPISNLIGLPTAPNKAGVIELTYALKRPLPVVYHPVYYVKYRMPYSTFVKSYQTLINKQSLRQRPESLHRKLLTDFDMTAVSPDLTSYGKEDILNLVHSSGQLIDAKLFSEIDTDNGNRVMDDNLNLRATQDNITPAINKTLNIDNGFVGNLPNIKITDSIGLDADRRLISNSPLPYLNPLYQNRNTIPYSSISNLNAVPKNSPILSDQQNVNAGLRNLIANGLQGI